MFFIFFLFLSFIYTNEKCRDIEKNFSSNFPYSFYVYDITSKKVISSCHKNLLLIPGSTLKVITSIYALEKFGPGFRFKTELIVKDKKGEGYYDKFIIRGGGDFTLGSENFGSSFIDVARLIFDILVKKGVKKVNEVIIENKYISFPHESIEWQDVGNYYASSVSFFSINDNLYKIYFKSGEEKKPVDILDIVPPLDFEIINLVTAASPTSGDNSYIYFTPYSSKAIVKGTIPALKKEFVVKGSLFRPDLFFAKYIFNYLNQNGINISSFSVSSATYDSGEVIDVIFSPKLSDIIKIINKKSFNLYADSLLHFSLIKENIFDVNKSISFLSSFLKENSIDKFRIVDGSGLSKRNLFTSESFVKMLSFAYRRNYFDVLYMSLVYPYDEEAYGLVKNFSIDGVDEVRVKSGSMSGVRSWCGYIKKGKKVFAFSFIFNNYLEDPVIIENTVKKYLSHLLKCNC